MNQHGPLFSNAHFDDSLFWTRFGSIFYQLYGILTFRSDNQESADLCRRASNNQDWICASKFGVTVTRVFTFLFHNHCASVLRAPSTGYNPPESAQTRGAIFATICLGFSELPGRQKLQLFELLFVSSCWLLACSKGLKLFCAKLWHLLILCSSQQVAP